MRMAPTNPAKFLTRHLVAEPGASETPEPLDTAQRHVQGLRRRGKEMCPILKLRLLLFSSQPQPRFVYERSGLQCLAWPFLGHLPRRQLAQLSIDQRQEFLSGLA